MLLHVLSTVLTLGGHAAALPLPNPADSIPAEAAREDILQLGDLLERGLRGSMSRTAVVYPGIPSAGGAVVMDVPLTWSLWGEFDFHPEAPVHAALAELRGTGR